MASNDQHQEQKRHNEQLHEQNRQLLDTIKKTLELQEKGIIPDLHIDPQILESLSHNDPEEYLKTLKKTAGEIRSLLSKLAPQNQSSASTHNVENVPSVKPSEKSSSAFNESHFLKGRNPISTAAATSISSVDEDEDDLYENTGPGSRIARLAVSECGKHFYDYYPFI